MSEYDNITFVKTIESEGRYVVAIMTKPFFRLSDKRHFQDTVLGYIEKKYKINSSNIRITFNIDIIYNIKNAKNKEDIKILVDKVYGNS